MLKPNKKRIKLWYDALMRSKKQTTGCLKDKDGRCCLGVACDVFKNSTGKGKWIKGGPDNTEKTYFNIGKETRSTSLPNKVVKWFGLSGNDPLITTMNEYASYLNDTEGFSFKHIAKKIKERFLN